jgi:hypothetical protein
LSGRDKELAEQVRDSSLRLLQAIDAQNPAEKLLAELDEAMLRGWSAHWAGKKPA